MTDSTIHTYAWDLAELGVAAATTQFRQHGIGGVTLATAYHAGKFLRPHGVGGKVYALYGRYRIALSWPALGMGQFMRIVRAPDAIHQTMGRLAGAPAP